MKRLLLIRHAKSSWNYPHLDDHDRPLNKRGKRDRISMAAHLAERGERLDVIYTSSAMRALSLAESLSEQLQVALVKQRSLYTFSAASLGSAVSELPQHYQSVAVVGHNPAVTDLVNQLTGENMDNVPTSGVVAINSTANAWQELLSAETELAYFVAPKLL